MSRKKASQNPLPALLPNLRTLFRRHPGLYAPLCRAYADAASICLSKHHKKSPVPVTVSRNGKAAARRVSWRKPSKAAEASQANQIDVTESGAYSVALATVESELHLIAITRAEVRTGADYYIGPVGGTGLEKAYRLEVSGTHSDSAAVRARLKTKVKQALDGEDDLPALACVVGFAAQEIALERVVVAKPKKA